MLRFRPFHSNRCVSPIPFTRSFWIFIKQRLSRCPFCGASVHQRWQVACNRFPPLTVKNVFTNRICHTSPIFSGRISDEVWSCKKRSWRHSAKPVYIAILFVRLAEVLMSNEERGDSCQRLNLKDFPACLMPMWGEGLPIRTCSALHNLT